MRWSMKVQASNLCFNSTEKEHILQYQTDKTGFWILPESTVKTANNMNIWFNIV